MAQAYITETVQCVFDLLNRIVMKQLFPKCTDTDNFYGT
jgi:hypothetical protein